MSDSIILEQRLEAIEKALAKLQHQVTGNSNNNDWLDTVAGSITDEEAFREALELGRAFREADRPVEQGEGDR